MVIQSYSLKKMSAKRGTTSVESKYDLDTSEKRKKKKSLTLQMVKYVSFDPTPPQPQKPPVLPPPSTTVRSEERRGARRTS